MEAESYLDKAVNSLKAAQLCFDAGLYDDAVSRAYYSLLRAAIALLVKLGLKPDGKRIHNWVQAVFARECVHRRKLIPRHIVAYFSELQNDRGIADYQPDRISKRTAERSLTKAKEFLNHIAKEIRHD